MIKNMDEDKKRLIEPRTLPGFRDFLPADAIKRQYAIDIIRKTCESYGFQPLETPAVEYLETFAGQIGEDEKLFFKFEDQGGRQVALRYDQTVPTCRVVAQYPNVIKLPFKPFGVVKNHKKAGIGNFCSVTRTFLVWRQEPRTPKPWL